MFYLLALAWLAVIAYIIWSYQRRTAERADRGAKRLDALLSDVKLRTPSGDSVSASAAARAGAAIGCAGAIRKSLLSDPARLLFYIFRAGLPDHLIFINLKVRDLIAFDSKSAVPTSNLALDVLNQQLDFVVCTQELQAVAAIIVSQGPANNRPASAERLAAAGIRLICVDSRQPPQHGQVRALIYGDQSDPQRSS